MKQMVPNKNGSQGTLKLSQEADFYYINMGLLAL